VEQKVNIKVDPKEFELPETLFVRAIEDRVFQAIILRCLSKIPEISLVEGNFIDSLLSGEGSAAEKGIYVEQDNKNPSVSVKVEVNVAYGAPIPAKAEEIQTRISEEITHLTGLHVSCVHVVFKNLIKESRPKKLGDSNPYSTSLQNEQYSEEL
jgi:uncharacterized alkaline shock family protein YloU